MSAFGAVHYIEVLSVHEVYLYLYVFIVGVLHKL